MTQRRRRWLRKTRIERMHLDVPAQPAQPIDDAPVVDIAASLGLEVTGHQQDQRACGAIGRRPCRGTHSSWLASFFS